MALKLRIRWELAQCRDECSRPSHSNIFHVHSTGKVLPPLQGGPMWEEPYRGLCPRLYSLTASRSNDAFGVTSRDMSRPNSDAACRVSTTKCPNSNDRF